MKRVIKSSIDNKWTLDSKIYDWYRSEYPDDYQLDKIYKHKTFRDIQEPEDCGEWLDTQVIDKIFTELDKLKNNGKQQAITSSIGGDWEVYDRKGDYLYSGNLKDTVNYVNNNSNVYEIVLFNEDDEVMERHSRGNFLKTYDPNINASSDIEAYSALGDFYFGKEEADKYGNLISSNLKGVEISKRQDLAEEPGGLIYEANELGIDMWDLLSALEGMCHQHKAEEIDDSTYLVL
jgi:hypothetical protein